MNYSENNEKQQFKGKIDNQDEDKNFSLTQYSHLLENQFKNPECWDCHEVFLTLLTNYSNAIKYRLLFDKQLHAKYSQIFISQSQHFQLDINSLYILIQQFILPFTFLLPKCIHNNLLFCLLTKMHIKEYELEIESDIIYNQNETTIYRKQFNYAIKKCSFNKDKDRQIQICIQIKHKNPQHLVKIHNVWQQEASKKYYIMMDYYPYNLHKYLVQKQNKLNNNPQLKLDIFLQILYGLIQLDRTHRDLKLTNILVNQLEDGQVKVVLCDFATCNKGQSINSSRVGSYPYMAPEIKFEQYGERSYSNKVDVWSLGIILYQILCGLNENQEVVFPYLCLKPYSKKLSYEEQKNFINTMRPLIPLHVPQFIRKLMRQMLEFSVESRISFSNLFQSIGQFLLQQPYPKKMKQKFIQYQKIYRVRQKFTDVRGLLNNFYIPLQTSKLKGQTVSQRYKKYVKFKYYGYKALKKACHISIEKGVKKGDLEQHIFSIHNLKYQQTMVKIKAFEDYVHRHFDQKTMEISYKQFKPREQQNLQKVLNTLHQMSDQKIDKLFNEYTRTQKFYPN